MRSVRTVQVVAVPACVAIALASLLTSVATAAATGDVCAPTRPVEFVVHTTAGGGSDVFARMIAEIIRKNQLSPQPFVVVNKPGGSGAVAIEYLSSKAGAPNVILATPVAVITSVLRGGVPVRFDELTPIARLQLDPNVWLVRADSPYKDAKGLFEAAKARPKQVTVGFGSIGSSDHLLFYEVAKATGVEFNYVNYPSGADAMVSLLGGHIDMASGQPSEALEQILAGKLRGILVFGTEGRLDMLPDVPTAAELGIKVAGGNPRSVLGPPRMPACAVRFFEDVFRKVTETADWKAYVAENGVVSAYLDSTAYRHYLGEQVLRINQLIDEMGIRRH